MPNRNPTPPPKGAGKFAIFAGAVVALIIVTLFVGMNAQHAQDSKNAQSGQIKSSDAPMHERDLGKTPVSR
jgi:hypothetical protein